MDPGLLTSTSGSYTGLVYAFAHQSGEEIACCFYQFTSLTPPTPNGQSRQEGRLANLLHSSCSPGRGSTDTCCLQSGLLPHGCQGQGVRAQGAAAPRLEQPLPSLHLCVTLAFSVFEIPDYRGPGRPEVIFPTIVLGFRFHFPGSPRSSGEGLCWVSSRYEGRGRGAENTLRSLSPLPPCSGVHGPPREATEAGRAGRCWLC